MIVIKRDGRKVKFNKNKIIQAINKCGSIKDELKQKIAIEIENCGKKEITVEEIQDLVEKKLMSSSYKDAAREYVRYRFKRELIRNHSNVINSILEITSSKNDYINTENSNKNPVILSTQRDYIAGELSKEISKKLLLSDDIVKAHEEGIIHFHDADYFAQNAFNCDLINLQDMFENGTNINGTMIERPHSFSTACNIMTQITAIVASNQYGGQTESLSHLAPFVNVSRQHIRAAVKKELADLNLDDDTFNRKVEEITKERLAKEITRGVQIIQYQILTLMTTNGQTPFVSLCLYLNEAEDPQTKDDLALIIEEVLKQRIQGIKNEVGVWVTPAFPKLLYVLEEDNIHENSKYWYLTELAAKCTAKRMVPDYISEKKILEYKYPKEKMLSIKERRDLWGDEFVYGQNPFKQMSDEECETLQKYVDELVARRA